MKTHENYINWSDLLKVETDEWDSTNLLFRILLVITHPIRVLCVVLAIILVFSYILTGFGVIAMIGCFMEGPEWLGWIILIFDLSLAFMWGYNKVMDK